MRPRLRCVDTHEPRRWVGTVPSLIRPVTLRGRLAPSRVMFSPHETNLARCREFSGRHVAYYAGGQQAERA
jgi:2,4-dienoyl-CoA reductase-like NADH-dependent reductase (Old Yellow Enzyme family)